MPCNYRPTGMYGALQDLIQKSGPEPEKHLLMDRCPANPA